MAVARNADVSLALPVGVHITVSIGGAVLAANSSVESAFQRANKALYDAKEERRNRVQFVEN